MARVGVEKLLGRLLGVKGLRVRGARFEPRGVVVEVLPPRRKSRCGVCGRPCPRYDSCPPRLWRHLALGAYSGDGEHPFQLKPSSRSGHGEQSERQRRWDVSSLHLLPRLRQIRVRLADGVPGEPEAVGVVDEPVEDGVGQRRVADDRVPVLGLQVRDTALKRSLVTGHRAAWAACAALLSTPNARLPRLLWALGADEKEVLKLVALLHTADVRPDSPLGPLTQ